ncbi:HD family hydrolase [Psychrobacter sp. JCM 18901]|uniref:HD domain-containing protein n=1 Tax=Psychrobacter sp. JCM 18901 TaxID=1298609 RepID=UPI0004BB927D|nr:HD domain-containing protein [Psychrobacter sp. JCM 18901]
MSQASSISLTYSESTSHIDIDDVTHFLLELDALKRVNRRSYVTQTTRKENSAEHSWHLAMACWSIAELFALDVNHEKLLKMALVHDLGEIDAGDTFFCMLIRVLMHTSKSVPALPDCNVSEAMALVI